MKEVTLLLLAACWLTGPPTSVAAPQEESSYITKYDNIDVDAVFRNDRLYKNYINCIMSRGKCTPDGQALKDRIKDAMVTQCAKCSRRQREGLRKALLNMSRDRKRQKDLKDILDRYDPDRKFRTVYRPEAEKHGIQLPP